MEEFIEIAHQQEINIVQLDYFIDNLYDNSLELNENLKNLYEYIKIYES